eukprot:GHRQ01013044.1.p4 GENE.GHRQ01013044.1~~GHRQ01013044.1.p4  ORF type:complete len:126 (-),score=30.48 GHRQ01013044.1:606-983(-)
MWLDRDVIGTYTKQAGSTKRSTNSSNPIDHVSVFRLKCAATSWRCLLQVLDVLASGAAPHVTRVMLDNMTLKDASCPGGVDVSLLKQAVAKVGPSASCWVDRLLLSFCLCCGMTASKELRQLAAA